MTEEEVELKVILIRIRELQEIIEKLELENKELREAMADAEQERRFNDSHE